MGKYVFACTHVTKMSMKDDFDSGLDGKANCLLDDDEHYTAPDMGGLLQAIGQTFDLDIKEVTLPVDMDENNVTRIEFVRDENGVGEPPTDKQRAMFKDGLIELWEARYTFTIELRKIVSITIGDLTGAGIKVNK